MQIVRVTVEDDVPVIPTFVAIVRDMQRLVHVANEVDDELQGFCFRRPVCLRVFQDGEKLLCLADDAITIRAFPWQVNLRIRQRDVDEVPRPGFVVVAAVIVGPTGDSLDGLAVQKVTGLGQGGLGHVAFGNQSYDSVPLGSPAKGDTARPEQSESGCDYQTRPRQTNGSDSPADCHEPTFVSPWSFFMRSSISGFVSTPFSVSNSTRALRVSMFE